MTDPEAPIPPAGEDTARTGEVVPRPLFPPQGGGDPSTAARPALITVVAVLAALNGIVSALIGTIILLSRYDADPEDVLMVSLIGAGVILFGLLTLAVAGGLGRGSRLSRALTTVYLGVQLLLAVLALAISGWDGWGVMGIVVDVLIVLALWLPRGARYFAAPLAMTTEPPSRLAG
ncbi:MULTISPECIES: hypothetical protein [unclassified Microbacterium]|uniref:hypothetical protein n=1 Tax=unclassified Microbacterium TaxID=2609290 RepID=UPI00364A272B